MKIEDHLETLIAILLLKIFPVRLMEPVVLVYLPCSQEAATFACPEGDRFSHSLLPYSLKVHFSNIISSYPKSTKWSLPLRFSCCAYLRIYHLLHAYYIPIHLSLLDTTLIVFGEEQK
jgi:hypothetical protein